jgi:hypothetical protein
VDRAVKVFGALTAISMLIASIKTYSEDDKEDPRQHAVSSEYQRPPCGGSVNNSDSEIWRELKKATENHTVHKFYVVDDEIDYEIIVRRVPDFDLGIKIRR